MGYRDTEFPEVFAEVSPKFFDTMKVFAVLALTSVAMAAQIQLRFRVPRTSEEVTRILERCDQKNKHGQLVVTYKSGDDIQLVNHSTGESVADQDGNVQSANAWVLTTKSDGINTRFDLGSKPLNFASEPQKFNPPALPDCWTQKYNTYFKDYNAFGWSKQVPASKMLREEGIFVDDLEVTISRCGPKQTTISKSEEAKQTTISKSEEAKQTTNSESEDEWAEFRAEFSEPSRLQPQSRSSAPSAGSSLLDVITRQIVDTTTEAVERHQKAKLDRKRRRLTAIDRESATAAHRRVLKRVRGY